MLKKINHIVATLLAVIFLISVIGVHFNKHICYQTGNVYYSFISKATCDHTHPENICAECHNDKSSHDCNCSNYCHDRIIDNNNNQNHDSYIAFPLNKTNDLNISEVQCCKDIQDYVSFKEIFTYPDSLKIQFVSEYFYQKYDNIIHNEDVNNYISYIKYKVNSIITPIKNIVYFIRVSSAKSKKSDSYNSIR